jgi:hypothetical protein
VAGFISEWWPESNRNGGRHQIGIPGRIASEFANINRHHNIVIGANTRSLDQFEATGLGDEARAALIGRAKVANP